MLKILGTAEYKPEQYFSTAKHFFLDMFVPTWFPTLSPGHLTVCACTCSASPSHFIVAPWMWKPGDFS